MSTDLELQHSLPEIRLRSTAAPSPEGDQQDKDDSKAIHENSLNHSNGRGDEDDEECRTPTSDEHKIPVMRSCPPAPKKQRVVVACKRKLSDELQFFETVGRDEIESFFRSSSSSNFNVKKRCCSKSNSNSNSISYSNKKSE